MIILPNGCTCSNLSVYPKNWKSPNASVKKQWYIHYRFYDPTAKDEYPGGKAVPIKGMNNMKTAAERRAVTQTLLDNELYNLKERGYNPITKTFDLALQQEQVYEIHPDTAFLKALEQALEKMKASKIVKANIKSALVYIGKAAKQLRIADIPIKDTKRRYLIMILERCGKIKEKWSPQSYNHYRAYLMMLFKYLTKMEAVENNPSLDIDKEIVVKKIRQTLTPVERKTVDEHLSKLDPYFRNFMHIFFHSGAREAEMMPLQVKNVDLAMQRYMVTVKKGQQYKEMWRPIKNIALPFWEKALEGGNSEDFVFSYNFRPGPKCLNSEYVTRRWHKLVKKQLDITADFYSLKHLNLDETAEALSIQDAAKMAAHTSPVITLNHYAFGEKARQDERLKKVSNSFV